VAWGTIGLTLAVSSVIVDYHCSQMGR
jgi:hypothetical protein